MNRIIADKYTQLLCNECMIFCFYMMVLSNKNQYETLSYSFFGDCLRGGRHEYFEAIRAVLPLSPLHDNDSGLCGRILFFKHGLAEYSVGHRLRHLVGCGHFLWLIFAWLEDFGRPVDRRAARSVVSGLFVKGFA